MTEKLIIRVDASDLVTVQDVFAHVMELFQLVDESDPEAVGQVAWRLVSATMNSPFTVTAEAIPKGSNLFVAPIAKRQARAFETNYAQLKTGVIPRAWSSPKNRETASRVLNRSRKGIEQTQVRRDDVTDAGVVMTADDATVAAVAIALAPPIPQKTKEQVGSVEGTLVQVGTHYGHPAILVSDRRTKEDVWCVVPEAFRHEIAEHTKVEDVWKGARVVVRGTISFTADGKISRVIASAIRRIEAKQVSEEQIADKNFTGGLSVTEYLERLRDGALG